MSQIFNKNGKADPSPDQDKMEKEEERVRFDDWEDSAKEQNTKNSSFGSESGFDSDE